MALHVLVFLLVPLIKTVIAVSENKTDCDNGWNQHDETCYMVVPMKQTWQMAQEICKTPTFGGQLAETNTTEVKSFLDGYLSKTFENAFSSEFFWLGGTDQFSDGNWVWASSNSSVTLQEWWDHATPRGNTAANCLTVGKPTMNKFKDENCQSKHFFICEKSALQATTTPASHTSQPSNGGGLNSIGVGSQTTLPPDIDVNHELPVFVG